MGDEESHTKGSPQERFFPFGSLRVRMTRRGGSDVLLARKIAQLRWKIVDQKRVSLESEDAVSDASSAKVENLSGKVDKKGI